MPENNKSHLSSACMHGVAVSLYGACYRLTTEAAIYSLIRCYVLTQDLASLHHSPEGVAVDSDIPICLHGHIFIEAHLGNMGAAEHHAGDVAVV